MPLSKVLVIGRNGQVASALAVVAHQSGLDYHFADRAEADLQSYDKLNQAVEAHKPDLIINCAAYTAVDKAEQEAAIAFAINATGSAYLAEISRAAGIPLISLSTDYVFDGSSNQPYSVSDPIAPTSAYGRSKAAGELAIQAILKEHINIRLAWVYGETGQNFLKTMLRVGADRDRLTVVDDQIGTPSYTGYLARAIDKIATSVLTGTSPQAWGTYHLTNAGQTSWHGFATEIFRLAELAGHKPVEIAPIPTSEYPTPAKRPAYSVLDCTNTAETFGVTLRPWQDGLKTCFDNILKTQPIKTEENVQ